MPSGFRNRASIRSAAAIADFEAATGHRDFRQFRIEWAQKYKRQLAERINAETGKPLAKATISSRLAALKAFFQWLAGQPGFRSKLTYSDAEYFNPSANDDRIAKAVREKPVASVEQIRRVLDSMPIGHRRSKARPGADRLHAADRRARQRDRLDVAQACRSRKANRVSGRARRADEEPQDVHHMVFPGRRRCRSDRGGLDLVAREAKSNGVRTIRCFRRPR